MTQLCLPFGELNHIFRSIVTMILSVSYRGFYWDLVIVDVYVFEIYFIIVHSCSHIPWDNYIKWHDPILFWYWEVYSIEKSIFLHFHKLFLSCCKDWFCLILTFWGPFGPHFVQEVLDIVCSINDYLVIFVKEVSILILFLTMITMIIN